MNSELPLHIQNIPSFVIIPDQENSFHLLLHLAFKIQFNSTFPSMF
jgi:hypothetical protein